MVAIQLKYQIILEMGKYASIVLICAALANAQDDGQYLDIRARSLGDGFISALPKGFHPGGSIIVNGTINPDATKFTISLIDTTSMLDGLSSNIFLHIAPRFNEKRIAFTYKIKRRWGSRDAEEYTEITSLRKGEHFQISIFCNSTGYMIDFNKNASYFFNHRFDTSPIRNICFDADANFTSVYYIPGNSTCVMDGCHDNSHCVPDGEDYYCKCDEGYSGLRCQESCKDNGCTGSNVCIIDKGKYACRSRSHLDDYSINNSTICKAPYVPVDTECILVVLTKLNWDAARFDCQKKGGFLMEPDFPINFRLYMSNNYPEVGDKGFWLGGADRGLNRWVWVNSLMDIPEGKGGFPWGEGEPNDLGYGVREDCMNLYTHSGRAYFYNDGTCDKRVYYICESPPMIPPTAAALVDDPVLASGQGAHQMQVAILLLLMITLMIVTGELIYKNIDVIKKVYGSFADHSTFALSHNTSKLREEQLI